MAAQLSTITLTLVELPAVDLRGQQVSAELTGSSGGESPLVVAL